MFKKIISLFFISFAFLVFVPLANAQTPPGIPEVPMPTLSLGGCCQQIVPIEGYETGAYGLNHVVQLGLNIYKCILCLVGSLMMLMIVIGGFILLTSAGNPGKVKEGLGYIKNAVIGGIIVFASFVIVNFVVKAFGASFIDNNGVNMENKAQINAGKEPVIK